VARESLQDPTFSGGFLKLLCSLTMAYEYFATTKMVADVLIDLLTEKVFL
jgi:hypothetical protein